MRIEEFERSGRGNQMRYVKAIGDEHELVIAGSGKVITEAFKEAEIEVKIDREATAESWQKELRAVRNDEVKALAESATLEHPDEFFKKRPPAPKPENAAFVSLRRTRGEGTRYFVSISNFIVPSPLSLFLGLPLVCSCFGVVTPRTGDQDLFLHLFAPFGPLVRFSTRGGTAVDVVTFSVFCTPFTMFVPWFQVFGFASGICSNFTFGGTDIFG